MHTLISCCMDMFRRKVLEAPSRATSTLFISLLTSIMKMLSHLSEQESSLSRTQAVRYHTWYLVSILYPFINRITSEKVRTVLPDSVTSFNLSVYQSFLFIMEMVFQFQYHQQKIISLLERVPCFRLMVPSHLLISVYVSQENLEEKFKSPCQVRRHPNDQRKSDKLLALVITARRANSVSIIWFSLWKWCALMNVRAEARLASTRFFAGFILWLITRRVITYFSSGLIPYINHFHYGNNIKQFSEWKSYCCCWVPNEATLNSTNVFHWSLFTTPFNYSHPIIQ